MEKFDFSKFDKSVDLKGLSADIEEAAKNKPMREEVPAGEYEVKVDRMELLKTGPNAKNPDMPMVSIWFKILNGPFKNSNIFYNKVIMGTTNDALSIHMNNELLRALDSGIDVKFESYSQYADLLMNIHEAIDGKLEYALEYAVNDKGFKTYYINEVFEV